MHLCCHRRECCSIWASENEFPWFNRYFTEMNSVCKYYNIQFLKIQLSYQDSYLQSLQFWDCYASGTWRVVLCRDPWTPVIAGVIRGDTRAAFAVIPSVVRGDTSSAFAVIPSVVCVDIMRHPRWNLARLGICTPCKLKNPICSWFLGFCEFYAACAGKVGQIDLFYGTDTHYDKNCWVYREALWLSARSPSEYAGKRLKMAVSKRLVNHHRAAGKISVLYIQTSSDHIMQKIQKASRSSVPS